MIRRTIRMRDAKPGQVVEIHGKIYKVLLPYYDSSEAITVHAAFSNLRAPIHPNVLATILSSSEWVLECNPINVD